MNKGDSATLEGRPPGTGTGTFALDLSREGITLYWLSSHGVWNAVEHVVLEDGLVAERMAQIRRRIVRFNRVCGVTDPIGLEVWLPDDQVILRVLDTEGEQPTEQMIAALFEDAPDGLEFDAAQRPGAGIYTIAAVPRAVLEETRDFLDPHGFVIENYTLRNLPSGMESPPVFTLESTPAPAPIEETETPWQLPPRAAMAAAGAGLLVFGSLLVGMLIGAFNGSQTAQRPEISDGAPQVGGNGPVGSVRFAEPADPADVGRAQIDLPVPATPEAIEVAGTVPQGQGAPSTGASPALSPIVAAAPRTPLIYAKPVQTDIAGLSAQGLGDAAPMMSGVQWAGFYTALPADTLRPAGQAGVPPDLTAIRSGSLPSAQVRRPGQGHPVAVGVPPQMPTTAVESYVAALPGLLTGPSASPDMADISGVRTRPSPVAQPPQVAFAIIDPAADVPARMPGVEAAPVARLGAPAPSSPKRTAALEVFVPPTRLPRPALAEQGNGPAEIFAEDAPGDLVLSRRQSVPAALELVALAAPSAASVPADLTGVRTAAVVDVAADWAPIQPALRSASSPPLPPAGEAALNTAPMNSLAPARLDADAPRIQPGQRQPLVRVSTDGTRPDAGEPQRIASLDTAPFTGVSRLTSPVSAVQPSAFDTPAGTDSQAELATLLNPANGVQVGRVFGPRLFAPRDEAAPRSRVAPDPATDRTVRTLPTIAMPGEVAGERAEVEVAALIGDLPRARIADRGTVPPLPDIEFTALERPLGELGDGPRWQRRPAMVAPSGKPGAVAVPLPAPPPDSAGTGVNVAVINAKPDVVPPLRPRPEVFASRPDVVPPLRPRPEVTEAEPDVVPPLREDAEEAVEPAEEVEVAALTDLDAEAAAVDDATADDGSDLALPVPIRPRQRPQEVEIEEAVRLAALAPSELALNRTDSPRRRPSDLARVQPDPAPTPTPAPAAVPSVSQPKPKRAVPELPTSASVARAATIENALPFGRMSLIGVFGASRNRHALIRLRNGSFVKVGAGDSIDGYRVNGITINSVRLNRGGRETLLVIPD